MWLALAAPLLIDEVVGTYQEDRSSIVVSSSRIPRRVN
jgi:hypothetical protein